MYIGPGTQVGQVLMWNGTLWVPNPMTGLVGSQGIFGDGSDASFTYDGATTPAWASRAGSVYTLTRNVYHTDCTINSGVEVRTANFQFFANGTCTGVDATSKITNNGTAGSAGGGLLFAQQVYGNGTSGGAGGGGNGGASGAVASAVCTSKGGDGGHGAGGNTGGVAGAVTLIVVSAGGPHCLAQTNCMISGRLYSTATLIAVGSGGGGGGGDGGTGGNGGGPGGILGVFVAFFAGAGTLEAKGGDGQSPAAGNRGGGGGGPGGAICGGTRYFASWTKTVAPGAGGTHTGAAPATDGATGGAGLDVFNFFI